MCRCCTSDAHCLAPSNGTDDVRNSTVNRAKLDLWPVDKVVLVYFAIVGSIEAIWFRQIPDATFYLMLHAVQATLIVVGARSPIRASLPTRAIWVFRNWYPLLFVAWCYREMANLIAAVRHARFDQALASLDYSCWGAYPTVWLERIYSPLLTESLQLVYALFIPMTLLVPAIAWYRERYADFRYMAFLLSLGYLVSYLGYLSVPVRGPRFFLDHLQHTPLQGLWFFDSIQTMLNDLEHNYADCFPSGHTELTIITWWLSRAVSDKLFKAYSLYTAAIIFATVYLRYHYTADLLAGVVVALILILAAPRLYRGLSREGEAFGD
jgi:membrane-associated phospholipid phosphatase